MDFRYELYLRPDDRYYREPDYSVSTPFRAELPIGWITKKEEHWQHYAPDRVRLPDQGWKIHISAQVDDAQMMLDTLSRFLFKSRVAFKHVITKEELTLKNSKYGERGSSGKFMTVYPRDTDHFIGLVNDLDALTKDFKKGPYILSDERWKEGNVYYRYGGFIDIPMEVDGRRTSGIRTPNADLIPDTRGATYVVPPFVDIPAEIIAMNAARPEDNSERLLERYRIETALHFSDGGGVYKATDTESCNAVVLKEGRPAAGLDGTMRDAYNRLSHESAILQRLSGSPFIPEWLAELNIWEHLFVVMEHVDGINLGSFIATRYPFAAREDVTAYGVQAASILENLIIAVEDVHSRGVGLGDLHPGNVIVDTERDNRIHLIDFELSSDISDKVPGGLITRGYVGNPDHNREQADWFALKRIARQVFLVVGPVEDLAGGMWERQKDWISRTFGDVAAGVLDKIDRIADAHDARQIGTPLSPAPIELAHETVADVVRRLREGLIKSLDPFLDQLGYGDIRQYEQEGGALSVAYGGFGIVLALLRSGAGQLPDAAEHWLDRSRSEDLLNTPQGLFSGKVGIANVLTLAGRHDIARELLDSVDIEAISRHDVALHSGFAGVGLGLLDAYAVYGSTLYLEKAIDCGAATIDALENQKPLPLDDPDAIPHGLLNGWTGAGLFLSKLDEVTNEDCWAQHAGRALELELALLRTGDGGDIQLESTDGRLLPYLQCGSGGIAVAMAELSEKLKSTLDVNAQFDGIREAAIARPCYGAGLFRGATGLLAVASYLHAKTGFDSANTLVPALATMNHYLIADEGDLFIPGDFNYRLSSDLATGSAGLITVLSSLHTTSLAWMPFSRLFQSGQETATGSQNAEREAVAG